MPVTAGAAAAGSAGAGSAAAGTGAGTGAGTAGAGGGADLMGKLGGASGKLGALGNIAALGLGAGQMLVGAIQRRKAMKAIPSAVDPQSLLNLATIRRRRKALETGTAFAADRAAGRQMMKTLATQSMKSGRPVNTGMLSQMLAQNAQNMRSLMGDQYNQVLGAETDLTKDITQRKFDVGMYKQQSLAARAEQNVSAGQDNLLAAIGMGSLKDKG